MKLWKLADLFHVSRQAVCRSASLQKTIFYDLVGLYQSSLEVVKSNAINSEINSKYFFEASSQLIIIKEKFLGKKLPLNKP